MSIVLQCLDVMLTKRRKQVTLQRAQAFVKRLNTLALHVLHDSAVGILAANRTLLHVSPGQFSFDDIPVSTNERSMYFFLSQTFPKCDILLDNEMQGSGVYLPELDEPEYCNPQNTALWELHLQKVIQTALQIPTFTTHHSQCVCVLS